MAVVSPPVAGSNLITLLLCRTASRQYEVTVDRVKQLGSVSTGQSGPPLVMDWHLSDRYLNAGADGVPGLAQSSDALGRLSPATFASRPLVPVWKGIVSGQLIGRRYRRARDRILARSRRLARQALRSAQTARTLRHEQQRNVLLKRARAFVARRRHALRIAPELRVPVEVRAISLEPTQPALGLGPLANATRYSSDTVQIEVAAGTELAIAGGPPLSYHHFTGGRRRWLAAHVPHVHPPTGFRSRESAATTRLDSLAPSAATGRRLRRLIADARQHRAVDCSSTSLDAVATARLIIDLAGAGTPLVATAVPDQVAELLGPDLVAAIEACPVERLTEPQSRERHSVALRRLVHRQHSVYENLAALATAQGHTVSASPSVSILMATNRPEMVTFAIKQMAAQQYPEVEILCGLHGVSLPPATREHIAWLAPHAQLIEVGTDHDVGQVLALLAERACGDLVTKWDDDDWYTTDHLLDLVSAMRYSGASVVAKGAEYIYLSSLDLTLRRLTTGAESFSTTVAGGTLMLTRSTLQAIGGWPAGRRRVDRLLIEAIESVGGTIYRAHGIGYLLRRYSSALNHTWPAEDDYFLSQAVEQRPGLDLQFAGVVP
ncbi:MAG TPA: glycosyltransferase [Propionibacteriaceae bacterium]|nr:glycosyltransferase [Propionibacteriaceae bacterium]